jgi:regulator of protease activity HflC (stomatin/prohibitin superfamily)
MVKYIAFISTLICFIIPIILFVIHSIYKKTVLIIEPHNQCVIERFGRYHKTLSQGIHIIIPFIDQLKYVKWFRIQENENSKICSEYYYNYLIPLNDQIYDPPEFQSFTKDNINVKINIVSYFKIKDVKKAVYNCDNLWKGINIILLTSLTDIIKQKDSLDIETNTIEGLLLTQTNLELENWGVQLSKIKIQRYVLPESLLQRFEEISNSKTKIEKLQLEFKQEKESIKSRHNIENLEQCHKINKEVMNLRHKIEQKKIEHEAKLKRMESKYILKEKYSNLIIQEMKYNSFKKISNGQSKTIILPYEAMSFLGSNNNNIVIPQ